MCTCVPAYKIWLADASDEKGLASLVEYSSCPAAFAVKQVTLGWNSTEYAQK